jgi:hypothetical protein
MRDQDPLPLARPVTSLILALVTALAACSSDPSWHESPVRQGDLAASRRVGHGSTPLEGL